jgi:hypothetical protein
MAILLVESKGVVEVGGTVVNAFIVKAKYVMSLVEEQRQISLYTKGELRDELVALKKQLPLELKSILLRFFDPGKFNWDQIQAG